MRVFSFMPSKSPWSDLRRIVISVPLWGIPFALFFGTLFGASRGDYIGAYVASLGFALSINLCIWAVTWFVRPRLIPDTPTPSRAVGWQYSALYGGSSMFGSLLAAVVLHLTIMPGFLGGPRQVAVVLMFAVLFVALFGALMYAVSYYRDSIERAKSDQELDLARRIQRSFLLSQFPAVNPVQSVFVFTGPFSGTPSLLKTVMAVLTTCTYWVAPTAPQVSAENKKEMCMREEKINKINK